MWSVHYGATTQNRRPAASIPSPGIQQWAMVLFESVGMMSVILVLARVQVAVGIFVQMIWPLTDWDLVMVMLEQYDSTVSAFLITVFVTVLPDSGLSAAQPGSE